MTLRKLVFWIHLIAGIAAGVVILVMSVTGVLLSYEKQIIAWADRELLAGDPPAGAPRLPVATLLARAKDRGAGATNLTLYDGSSTIAIAANGSTTYINSHTGDVLGESSTRVRAFFRSVTDWHRYLALAGESRATGKAITGASNLVFLFIVVSGLFIWWPRKVTAESLRAATWFRRGLRGRARNWNWHNVFGAWTAVPLFFVVLSGTVLSYPWASNLVYRVTGTAPPAQNEGNRGGNRNGNRGRAAPPVDLTGVDAAIAAAERQSTDWHTIAVRLQGSSETPLNLTVDRGAGGQPQHRSTLTVDRKTGSIITSEAFQDQNLGRRARSWLRYVHTGEYYGIAGQTIAGVASFAGVMLVWTGFALSLQRFNAWRRRPAGRQTAEPAVSAPAQPVLPLLARPGGSSERQTHEAGY